MDIIKKPVITEKMTGIGEKLNRYGFIVDKRANKLQIKAAVKEIYGVEVLINCRLKLLLKKFMAWK